MDPLYILDPLYNNGSIACTGATVYNGPTLSTGPTVKKKLLQRYHSQPATEFIPDDNKCDIYFISLFFFVVDDAK